MGADYPLGEEGDCLTLAYRVFFPRLVFFFLSSFLCSALLCFGTLVGIVKCQMTERARELLA